ncbi:hypothetical protein WMY93_021549 [Mugilogobius chulae]|uniref:Serine/arginine repetitive matrix protein C-terminal domain-containing protein n=1 Tax=Mugilogobius chulae TaxID=88201 RepID=A0AAW0NL56_9GOBI
MGCVRTLVPPSTQSLLSPALFSGLCSNSLTTGHMQEALSALSDLSSVAPVYALDPGTAAETQAAHRPVRSEPASSSHSHSRGAEKERGKGRDKKKKKHKKRSRSRSKSRSRSRSKSKHSLPSAYRRAHRSRSRSYSPGRRSRRGASSERRYEDRERERYHRSNSSSGAPRGRSRSRSPPEKSRGPLISAFGQAAGSSLSPYSSPRGASRLLVPPPVWHTPGTARRKRQGCVLHHRIVCAVQNNSGFDGQSARYASHVKDLPASNFLKNPLRSALDFSLQQFSLLSSM